MVRNNAYGLKKRRDAPVWGLKSCGQEKALVDHPPARLLQ
jgi:hypothetical protein